MSRGGEEERIQSPYFLEYTREDKVSDESVLRISICSEDSFDYDLYCAGRPEVKFVTFNKNRDEKASGCGSPVSGIFDDGVTVPVRPPRRKKLQKRILDDANSMETNSVRDNHYQECVPETSDVSDSVNALFAEDPTFNYHSDSSFSTVMFSSDDTDSFTNCSDFSDARETSALLADSEDGFSDCFQPRKLSDSSSISESVRSFVECNAVDYRSTQGLRPRSMESNYSQFHSLSSEASRFTDANEHVDLEDGEIRGSLFEGGRLSCVERWILDIYFDAFDDQENNVQFEKKWFYSNDEEGRVYYFEENSSESSWTLPAAGTPSSNEKSEELHSLSGDHHVYSNLPVMSRSSISPSENAVTTTDNSRSRAIKSKSMIFMEVKNDDPPMSFSSKNWPQLSDGHMCVLKEGYLNRTKITENGKRLRKNWASSYVALTELFLLFFKDAKSFAAWKSSGVRPEMCVDLNGALIDRGDKVSSRKNVYMISTVLGMQVLIQNDCAQQAELWLTDIQSAIKKLPSGFDSCPRLTRSHPIVDDVIPENESKKFYKVTRSKSVKAKNKDGSMEDLTVSPAERQTKIKAKLKKFFHRRPTMESLVKKGIWKDEPAFGCFLDQAAGSETPRVPLFVQRCISCIEKSDENMKTDGLYRASGNLSQVQKIRLQVDQNNFSVIEEEEDVHVLTGALKLFFRELKEPLIPYHLFQKAIKAGHNHNKKEKISQFREIVKALPTANYDTLKYLLQHLLRITKYKEFNRMHIPNIAIVFGPTLMWPEQESNNMALDLMQQNLVIECLLVEYDNIFR